MSKIKSIYELQDKLDRAFSWRVVEISYLRSVLAKTPERKKSALIRASIPVLYAHWEGFIKQAAKLYLDFVSGQNLKYHELNDSFVAVGLMKELSAHGVKGGKDGSISSVNFFRQKMNCVAVFPKDGVINTKSNLNSEVMNEILSIIGVDKNVYQTKGNFIDESLLARRNSIAHGEYLDLNADSYDGVSNTVVALLRQFKNDIENNASQALYKRTAA